MRLGLAKGRISLEDLICFCYRIGKVLQAGWQEDWNYFFPYAPSWS